MIKFCVEQWDKNKEKLEKHLSKRTDLNDCEYRLLVELVVEYIFNDNEYFDCKFNKNKITCIDNGDYQGTLLYLIPRDTYQPSEYEYLMTYVEYGSCSGCDTLQSIQIWSMEDNHLTPKQLRLFMALCKDIVINTIKPYNTGWKHDERFDVVEVEVDA